MTPSLTDLIARVETELGAELSELRRRAHQLRQMARNNSDEHSRERQSAKATAYEHSAELLSAALLRALESRG